MLRQFYCIDSISSLGLTIDCLRFVLAGLNEVNSGSCTVANIDVVFGECDGQPVHLQWEAMVQWVHPCSKFVLNEALLSLSRAASSAPWTVKVLDQQSLADDPHVYRNLPDDAAAMKAITCAVSQFNNLGGLVPAGVVIQKVWGTRVILSYHNSHKGRRWMKLGVAVEAICSESVASCAVMLVRHSSGWNADVVHMCVLEQEAKPVASRVFFDPSASPLVAPDPIPICTRRWPKVGGMSVVGKAVVQGLDAHNRYRELGMQFPIEACEVVSVRFSRCSAGGS